MDYDAIFRVKFEKAEFAIDDLRLMIAEQRGVWIFRRHVYSREALLKAPQFDRVYTVCEKIGSDVLAWHAASAFPPAAGEPYRKARTRIARRLNTVRQEIRQRQATSIERFLEFFDGFVTAVVDLLPTLGKLAKMAVNVLVGYPVPKLLPSAD